MQDSYRLRHMEIKILELAYISIEEEAQNHTMFLIEQVSEITQYYYIIF